MMNVQRTRLQRLRIGLLTIDWRKVYWLCSLVLAYHVRFPVHVRVRWPATVLSLSVIPLFKNYLYLLSDRTKVTVELMLGLSSVVRPSVVVCHGRIVAKRCEIKPIDCYWSLIESRILAFKRHENHWPWMTLKRYNYTLMRLFSVDASQQLADVKTIVQPM